MWVVVFKVNNIALDTLCIECTDSRPAPTDIHSLHIANHVSNACQPRVEKMALQPTLFGTPLGKGHFFRGLANSDKMLDIMQSLKRFGLPQDLLFRGSIAEVATETIVSSWFTKTVKENTVVADAGSESPNEAHPTSVILVYSCDLLYLIKVPCQS